MHARLWACLDQRRLSKSSCAVCWVICFKQVSWQSLLMTCIEELLNNSSSVLHALRHFNLWLSASKTVINPHSTNILGWVWSQGKLQPSLHRVSTLAACELPKTVGGVKSFIGAVKVMACVIQHCSALLAPLDDAIAGKTSHDNITWTEEVHCAFNKVKECLSSSRSVTLPRSDDQLWIVSDAAVRRPGIAATLYIMRNNKLALAGFFSVKLPNHQLRLPCEVEALAIAATVKHFGPYIIQSCPHRQQAMCASL